MRFLDKIMVSSLPLLLLLFSFASASQYPTGGQILYSRSGTVIGTPYYNLTQSQFTLTLPDINPGVKLARLSLDAELGWIYFTYFTNPTKLTVAASRFNYLVNSLQSLISYAGAGDPWTRPSFVLDLQDNLLLWTASGSAMRAVTNGAQSKEITPYGVRVTALAYDQIRKNISLISLTTKGDYYTYDLYTINVDGSDVVKVGQIAQWSYRSYPNMAIITSYDGLVFVGYNAYDFSSTQKNVIAIFMKGVGQPLALWSGDDKEVGIITDLIYDHKSRSLVWITVLGQIWKGQLNSNNTKLMDAKILLNDSSIDEGITLTQSGCDFNCFLNGACDESTKTCSCAPNYYPSSTCQTFCTREDTCSGHGSCSSTDGSCICDLNWEGSKCDKKKKLPPIFPNAFIAQNVTFNSPNFGTATATVSMNQPLQMERFDWSNGTITILRYDLGFRFDLFKGSCNTSILSGELALFRVPANAVLKGTVQCSAPTQCNEWWSESAKQTYYTTKDPSPGVDAELPVMIKDYTTNLQTSYSVLLFKAVVPEKSLFDFPSICIPKI